MFCINLSSNIVTKIIIFIKEDKNQTYLPYNITKSTSKLLQKK